MGFKDEFQQAFGESPWEKFSSVCAEIQNSGINYKFRQPELLHYALAVKSSQLEKSSMQFERLEFLGDSILDMAVAKFLYTSYPEFTEKDLSVYRAHVTNNVFLSNLCSKLKLNLIAPVLKLNQLNSHQRADMVEAVIGALYLDLNQHFPDIANWLSNHIGIDEIIQESLKNPWGELDQKSFLFLKIQQKYSNHADLIFTDKNLGTRKNPIWKSQLDLRLGKKIMYSAKGPPSKTKKNSQKKAAESLIIHLLEEGVI